jgi:hypothetical protein
MMLVAFAVVCSPALADERTNEIGRGTDDNNYYSYTENVKSKDDSDSYFQRLGYTQLHIPANHYPPPGECRIWYPDRPAEQQPLRLGCSQVPPGAWIIQHPKEKTGFAHVIVLDPGQADSIYVIGEFNISSGKFERIVPLNLKPACCVE